MSHDLPTMTDLIQFHLKKEVNFSYFKQSSNTCMICQDDLVIFYGDAQRPNVVQLPSCPHIYHEDCILGWMNGTAANRNRCPACQTQFCLLNVLSAEKEAIRERDMIQHNNEAAHFDANAYQWLMAQTDNQFETQYKVWRLRGTEDYMRIIGIVRGAWINSPRKDNVICQDHAYIGLDWIDHSIADRIDEKLQEANEYGSKAGRLFKAHHDALHNNYVHFHSYPRSSPLGASGSASPDVMDDRSAEQEAVQPNMTGVVVALEPEQTVEEERTPIERLPSLPQSARSLTPLDVLAEVAAAAPPLPMPPSLPGRASSSSALSPPYYIPTESSYYNTPSQTNTVADSFYSHRDYVSSNRASPFMHSGQGSVASAPSRRSRRSSRSRIDEVRHNRELQHHRQALATRERRRILRQYDIVTELGDMGQIRALGGMAYRVWNRTHVEICTIQNATGYTHVGDKTRRSSSG